MVEERPENVLICISGNISQSCLDDFHVAFASHGFEVESSTTFSHSYEWVIYVETPECDWTSMPLCHIVAHYTHRHGRQKRLSAYMVHGRTEHNFSSLQTARVVLILNTQSYYRYLQNLENCGAYNSNTLYIVLHPAVDTATSLKNKQRGNDMSTINSIADVALRLMVEKSCLSDRSDQQEHVPNVQILRSASSTGSVHVMDFLRYLMKTTGNTFAPNKKKRRKNLMGSDNGDGHQLQSNTINNNKFVCKRQLIYHDMLCAIPGVTPGRAETIQSVFPSLKSLLALYDTESSCPKHLLSKTINEKAHILFSDEISAAVYEALCVPIMCDSK